MNVGIDLIPTEKFKALTREDYSRWDHVFSEKEWEYAFRDAGSYLHLAGIFAAKEAAMKATGKVGKEHYRTFEITHSDTGAPVLNKEGLSVSITHTDDLAAAIVFSV